MVLEFFWWLGIPASQARTILARKSDSGELLDFRVLTFESPV